MRPAERFIQLVTPLGVARGLQQRENRADVFQVFCVLALKNGGELLANIGQRRYRSVAVRSSAPIVVRLAADLSVCRVLVGACSVPRLKSLSACMTFSKPT